METEARESKTSATDVRSRRESCLCLSFLEWLTVKLKLVEEGATPPNWKYIGLVFMALFSSSSTLTFLFPFLPEMMLTFGYSENEKGTYGGLIASSVFAGRILGSVFWGWLADRQGRKIVLLITIILNGLFAGLFGFSKNIYVAILFRFLCGAVNGTVGTAKTILYDISDNTNQAVSMSMLSISWGMGMIVGPTVGGVLASPALKWPHVFSEDGLFGQFPYLLSSLFPTVTSVFIFIVIFFTFDETFVIKSFKRDEQEIEISDIENIGGDTVSTQLTVRDNHLPFLGGMSRGSQNSLFRIGQSMHSVNLEAESSAYLAMVEARREEALSPDLHPLKAISVPDIVIQIGNQPPYSLDESPNFFRSVSNIDSSHLSKRAGTAAIKNENTKNVSNQRAENLKELYPLLSGNGLYHQSKGDDVLAVKEGEINIFTAQNGHGKSIKDVSGETWEKEKTTPADLATEGDNLLVDCQDKVPQGKTNEKHQEEEEEKVCTCVESCCMFSCCGPFRGTSIYKLLRLVDVWATMMLYTVLSFVTIAVEDIFPVFASTRVDYGGLGFTTDEIGIAIGAMVLPLLFLQIKLYPFLVSKMGIRKVFMFSALVCLVTCQIMPTVRLLTNHRVWLWVCLIAVQIPFKIATNCCFAGTSLLINNSVTQELAGQANGLAMMTTAMGRTIAPILAGSLFSWSVTYGPSIGTPFDTSFPFFVLASLYSVSVIECLYLNPRLDRQKK